MQQIVCWCLDTRRTCGGEWNPSVSVALCLQTPQHAPRSSALPAARMACGSPGAVPRTAVLGRGWGAGRPVCWEGQGGECRSAGCVPAGTALRRRAWNPGRSCCAACCPLGEASAREARFQHWKGLRWSGSQALPCGKVGWPSGRLSPVRVNGEVVSYAPGWAEAVSTETLPGSGPLGAPWGAALCPTAREAPAPAPGASQQLALVAPRPAGPRQTSVDPALCSPDSTPSQAPGFPSWAGACSHRCPKSQL